MHFLLIFVFFVFVVFVIIASSLAAKRRRTAIAEAAFKLGLQFSAGNDYSFDERYPFLNKLCQGSSRYAFNIMHGSFLDHPVIVFDYHYETHSRDSKGKRKTHHHYFSFFILNYDQNFPELIVGREGWLSKVAQFFGYEDIDFESAEFSRKFIVRSPDKKFAYDIFHSRMIEYMMHNPDLSIEIERGCLTLFFPRRLSAEQIPPYLERLVEIREMFPGYFNGTVNDRCCFSCLVCRDVVSRHFFGGKL